MYELSETITQNRIRSFTTPDPLYSGLTASLDDSDVATITFVSIEGQTALRIPGAMLQALVDLLPLLIAEVTPTPPPVV